MRRWSGAVIAVLVLAMVGLVAPAASAARAPHCGIPWGSLAKSTQAVGSTSDPLVNVRAGRHTCFDRLVLDVAGDVGGSSIGYVPAVTEDGSGNAIPLRGGAFIQINVSSPEHDGDYNPTYRPANRRELVNVSGWRTFRQIRSAGTFEGITTLGLGVRARLPFRVFVLDGPGDGSRLVIDVAHRW